MSNKNKKRNIDATKPLTSDSNTHVRFELCFKYKLDPKYNFEQLEKRDLKSLQNFLDNVSSMNLDEVLRKKKCVSDKNDFYNGIQVEHFKVTESFRIHAIRENSQYKVIRLDPNHTVHNK